MTSKQEQDQQARIEFYNLLRELRALLAGLGPHKAKRAMDIVMQLKNETRFMFLTIIREKPVPDDISSLFDDNQEDQ